MTSEGAVHLVEGKLEAAERALLESARLGRETRGEIDVRAAQAHTLLGKVAMQRSDAERAIDYFSTAWEVNEALHGSDGEPTLRTRLLVAEAEYAAGKLEEAIQTQQAVVDHWKQQTPPPLVVVEAAAQLARWLEAESRDKLALEALQTAELAVRENLGPEDAQVVDVKRDLALLHLKLGDHDTALQYLNDVHYLERRLHGSQSTNVARTLKALGTVHLVRRNFDESEQCLLQALRIFESDYPPNTALIRDIHAKLATIASTL